MPMPFDAEMTPTSHKAAALTAASALALYEAAISASDQRRAAAAMAEVLRRQIRKPKGAPKAEDAGLTVRNLAAVMRRITAIAPRKGYEITRYVAIRSADGVLTFRSTDFDRDYVETLPAPGIPAFEVAVNAHDLRAALRATSGEVGIADATVYPEPGETVKKRCHQTNTDVDVPAPPKWALAFTFGGAEVILPGRDAKELPALPEPESAWRSAVMPAARLRDPLKFVLAAVSAEETRYYLNGVYMHGLVEEGVDKLAFVATDGAQMRIDFGADSGGFAHVHDLPGVILPRLSVEWLVSHLGSDPVTVEVTAAQTRFSSGAWTLTTKNIDGNFPDYRRVIPRDPGPAVLRLDDPADMARALKLMIGQSKEKHAFVDLSSAPEKVALRYRSLDGNEAEAPIDCAVAAGTAAARFNGRYLLGFLGDGAVSIRFGATDHVPAVLSWPAQPQRVGVIMPIRKS